MLVTFKHCVDKYHFLLLNILRETSLRHENGLDFVPAKKECTLIVCHEALNTSVLYSVGFVSHCHTAVLNRVLIGAQLMMKIQNFTVF